MELDDFKSYWKKTSADSDNVGETELLVKLAAYRKSSRGIRNAFFWELFVIVVLYLGVLAIVIFLEKGLQSYLWKMIVVSTVGGAPICYRLFKSQHWINNLDYSKDIRSNVEEFLSYYKTTLKWYKWCTYGTIALSLLLFFLDAEFRQLNVFIKLAIVIYMGLFFACTGPYIKRMYGRKVGGIEEFLA